MERERSGTLQMLRAGTLEPAEAGVTRVLLLQRGFVVPQRDLLQEPEVNDPDHLSIEPDGAGADQFHQAPGDMDPNGADH